MLSQSDASSTPRAAPADPTPTDPHGLDAPPVDESEVALSDSGVEYVHRSWPADPTRLAVIRRELRRWLAPLGLSTDETDDVVLAVDEAVANAVRHAYPADRPGEVELTLWTEGRPAHPALCIEITDHGSWRAADTVTGDSRGGRGMLLMQHLVETVLVHFDGRGSRVLLRHRFSRPTGRHAREA
jgi:anti-sigma regulatory factor (Ser/Thr protein kinase)